MESHLLACLLACLFVSLSDVLTTYLPHALSVEKDAALLIGVMWRFNHDNIKFSWYTSVYYILIPPPLPPPKNVGRSTSTVRIRQGQGFSFLYASKFQKHPLPQCQRNSLIINQPPIQKRRNHSKHHTSRTRAQCREDSPHFENS